MSVVLQLIQEHQQMHRNDLLIVPQMAGEMCYPVEAHVASNHLVKRCTAVDQQH